MALLGIKFNYQCSNAQEQSIALAIEGITQSGKVFLNNELLWQDLSVTEPSSRSQNLPRLWNLTASSLRQGENIVWVQVYGSITQKSGLGRVTIDHHPETYKIFKSWLLEKRVLLELNAMVNIVVGMFYFLAWLANRKEKAFFGVAITGLA